MINKTVMIRSITNRHRRVKRYRHNWRPFTWSIAAWIGRVLILLFKIALAASRRSNDNFAKRNAPQRQPQLERIKRRSIGANTKSVSNVASIQNQTMTEAISALVNLGYRKSQAYTAISVAVGTAGEDADIATLIKLGLKALAN